MTIKTSRGKFSDLADKINQDPTRRARVDQHKQEAIADHIASGLAELRSMREITQAAIATQLGMAQPNVSRLERQDDVLLSTLRAYVEGLGGRLELHAVFGDTKTTERVPLAIGDEAVVS